MSAKTYYVYIMASRSLNLYTGITNSIYRRALQHKRGEIDGFTKRYNINRWSTTRCSTTSGVQSQGKKDQVVDASKTARLDCNEKSDVARPRRGLGRKVRTADPSARRMILQSSGALGMTGSEGAGGRDWGVKRRTNSWQQSSRLFD